MPTPDPAPPTTTATLPDDAAHAAAPPAMSPSPNPPSRRRVHPLLRWPLRLYAGLIGVLVAGVLSNVLLIPLAQGFANYGAHALGQVAALVTVAQTYPVYTVVGVVALLLLYGVSLRAQREANREAQAAADAATATIAKEVMEQQAPIIAKDAAEQVSVTLAGELESALERAIATGERVRAAADKRVLPAGVIAPGRGGLPLAATTLFGRSPQVAAMLTALRTQGAVNVCAVEGQPGIGKTALAAQVVAEAVAQGVFPTAIWLSCEGLHGTYGLTRLWPSVAGALGADEIARIPQAEAQREALRTRLADPNLPPFLLALDNVEPDLDLPPLLATLTGGQATLLLTTRERLLDARIHAFPLTTLDDESAQALFRAQLHLSDPQRPTPAEEPDLLVVTALLAGLPLALELTARYAGARIRSLATVADEIRADGLAGGGLATLRARIDRSWALLTPAQQRLFAGLAIIEGATFPRAAGLEVAKAALSLTPPPPKGDADAPPMPPTPTASDELDALVGLSLVEAQVGERLRLHPLIRQYARDQFAALAPDDQQALGMAVCDYWLAFAEAHPDYDGMDALEAEADGLHGALTWAHARQQHRTLLAIAHALETYWDVRGRVIETRQALPWAIEAARVLDDKPEQRWALGELAVRDAQSGELTRARAGYQEALALARESDDKRAIQGELHGLAVLDAESGDSARARTGFEEALALARELGDKRAIRDELRELAVDDAESGEVERARTGFHEALALARELKDKRTIQSSLHDLAVLDSRSGKPDQARVGYQEALALARELGDKRAIRAELHDLAMLDANNDEPERARASEREALALAHELGDKAAMSRGLQNLGTVDLNTGVTEQARGELTEALTLAHDVQQPALVADAAWWLAELCRRTGEREAAIAGFREALAIYERLGNPNAEITRQALRMLGALS